MSLGSFPCWFRWLVNILRKGCEEKNKEGILPNLPPQVPSSRSADVRLDLWIQSCSCPLVGPAAEPKVGPCSPINTRLFGSSPDRVNLRSSGEKHTSCLAETVKVLGAIALSFIGAGSYAVSSLANALKCGSRHDGGSCHSALRRLKVQAW